jgi:hypothetical protein
MKVKLILPALTEAESPFWRPIKYSLFPPLGLATLAAYLSPEDEIDLQDQHVEKVNLDDECVSRIFHGRPLSREGMLRDLRRLACDLIAS